MIARLAMIVLLAAAVAACGQQAIGPTPAPVPAPAPAAAAETGAGRFGPTERAFVELSIATDDAAVRLLNLGARGASSPTLRELARDLGKARRDELTALHGILDAATVPYVNNHEGHDMPGMPTGLELDTLSASGPDFDAMFARLLRAHLDESAQVVRAGLGSVTHGPTRAAAQRMEQERATGLRQLHDALSAG